MKKIFLLFIVAAAIFSFKTKSNNSLAEVNQIGGYYIFVDSKPSAEYDYLGTVKGAGFVSSAQYQPVRDGLIRKARKKFPNGDGLIFNFANGSVDKVDVIKFKE